MQNLLRVSRLLRRNWRNSIGFPVFVLANYKFTSIFYKAKAEVAFRGICSVRTNAVEEEKGLWAS